MNRTQVQSIHKKSGAEPWRLLTGKSVVIFQQYMVVNVFSCSSLNPHLHIQSGSFHIEFKVVQVLHY